MMDDDISDPDFKGEISEADLDTALNFDKRQLYPRRCVKAIKVSRDLLNLSTPDIGAFVIGRGEYKLSVVMENTFLNGTWETKPHLWFRYTLQKTLLCGSRFFSGRAALW